MDFVTENINSNSEKGATAQIPSTGKDSVPSVFNFVDYRLYLKEVYEYRKGLNPSYSENAFIFAAGFGKNSRGYLGLILKGKRNLTAKSIIGFSNALNLNSKEALFFENMVNFNQATTEKEKVFFFERMKVASTGEKVHLVEVLSAQYRYINEWHINVLREIVVLKDFKEDLDWLHKKMGGRLTKEKIAEGMKDLINLGLLTRAHSGALVQSDPVVIFNDNKSNFKNSSNLHKQFAERAAHSIMNEPYEKRAAQLITLAIPASKFEDVRKEMQDITKMMLKKYGHSNNVEGNDHIIQMGIQLIHVTEK